MATRDQARAVKRRLSKEFKTQGLRSARVGLIGNRQKGFGVQVTFTDPEEKRRAEYSHREDDGVPVVVVENTATIKPR